MTRSAWILAAAAVLGLAAGCSSEPGSPVASGRLTGPAVPIEAAYASSVIGPGGGDLAAGAAQLAVPAGALGSPVVVGLDEGVAFGRAWCAVSPAGLALAVSGEVSLPLPANPTPGAVYHIFGLDPVSGTRVDLGGTVGLGRISTLIGQFSRFEVDIAD